MASAWNSLYKRGPKKTSTLVFEMDNMLERKRHLRAKDFKRQVKRWGDEEQTQRIFQEMTSVIPPSIELERVYQRCKREDTRPFLQKQNWLHQ